MYNLIYFAKGSSKNISPAIRLSNKLNAEYDDKTKKYSIESLEFNKDFKKLLDLVKNLRGTELKVNNEEIDDIDLYSSIISCPRKRSCDGICSAVDDYKEIFECIGILDRPSVTVYNEYIFESLKNPDLIVFHKNETLGIDKNVLKNQYINDTKLSKLLCEKYSLEKLDIRMKTFNDTINVELGFFNNYEESENNKSITQKINDETNHHFVISLSDDTIDKLAKTLVKYLKN